MDEGQFIHAPLDQRGTRWLWVAALLALLALALRQPLLLILATVLALVAAFARLWWRYGLRAVTYRRHFSTARAAWGEEISCELITENAKPLPLVWLEVVDEFPTGLAVTGATLEPSSKVGTRLLRAFFSVGPYERVRRRYRIRCRARGYYRFGPVTLTTGDPFGFAAREEEFPVLDALVVYPRILPVTAFGLPARQPLGDLRAIPPLIEDPLRFAGVRPYSPGDSPRHIHWRASARTGALQTRQYERTATPTVALFLDANTFEYFWQGFDPPLLELAITATASLAAYVLDAGWQVGLFANAPASGATGFGFIRLAPSRHPAQLPRLLEALARLIPGSSVRIERVLLREAAHLRGGTTVVVVTGNVTADLQRALLTLARRGQRPVLVSCGTPPDLAPGLLRQVLAYHLGGEEAWDALTTLALAG
jgi:uncharacterized protein (DUF58 family)